MVVILVMLESRMSSSLTTLSISLRLSSSVIKTFHCGESALFAPGAGRKSIHRRGWCCGWWRG